MEPGVIADRPHPCGKSLCFGAAGRGAVAWGIQLRVAEPQSVGADRAVNAIAAHALADLVDVDVAHHVGVAVRL